MRWEMTKKCLNDDVLNALKNDTAKEFWF